MRIDSPPDRFVSAVIWPLALVAGYAAAVIANIEMFLHCGREICYSGSLWSTLPGGVGTAVGCWFVRHRSSYRTAALAGAGVAVAVVASGAPLWPQNPMPTSSSAGAVLGFYDRVFDGWRRLDRTADDGIWI